MSFEKRSIGVAIVLSIVTCGIYGIYWYYCIARDFYNSQTENSVSTTPGVTIILNIVTCGIYGIYAYYKWGKQTPEVYARYGQYGEDKSIMYLLLSIFGFAIINMAVIQSDFNKLADMPAGYYPPPGAPYPPYGAPQQSAPPPQGGYDQAQQPGGAPPPPPLYTSPEQAAPPPPIYQPPVDNTPPPPPPGSPYDAGNGDNTNS